MLYYETGFDSDSNTPALNLTCLDYDIVTWNILVVNMLQSEEALLYVQHYLLDTVICTVLLIFAPGITLET